MTLGDFDTSSIIYGKFTTYRPSTGAPYTLAGTPAISVYKDNSLAQSTSGVTLTTDFDTVTGLNHFSIDTSSDGTFYSSGSFYDIVITAGTVDSVNAIGMVIARFTLRKVSTLKPTTAGRTININASGGVDFASFQTGSFTSTTLAASALDTAIRSAIGMGSANLDTQLSTLSSSLVTIASYIDTEVAAIKAKTDNLPSDPADASDIATSFSSIASTLTTISSYIDTEVAAIKAKTDQLVFTKANEVDVNIQSVNDITVTGDGAEGTEWGP